MSQRWETDLHVKGSHHEQAQTLAATQNTEPKSR